MKRILFLLIPTIFFSSCEQTAEVDVPVTDPMLAVFGFVEPGAPLTVKVENVSPIFAEKYKSPGPVSGATVIVREGSNEFIFNEDPVTPGFYVHPTFVGAAGKTYSLEVIRAGYPSVTSGCRVPGYLPQEITHTYVANPEPYGGDSSRLLAFHWQDTGGTENFYRYLATAYFQPGGQPVELYFEDQNMKDKGKDGSRMSSPFGRIYGGWSQAPISLSVSVELMALDEHAFRYMQSHDASLKMDDNPFTEPVIMYTNIKGGVGIFGGTVRRIYNLQVY